MAAPAHRYACQVCGATHPRWAGRCDACGAWNAIVEEAPREAPPKGLGRGAGRRLALVDLSGSDPDPLRATTGIGKSTLLLQAATALARQGLAVVYVSGEEAAEQVRLRARRLGLADAPVKLAAATSVRDILTSLEGDDPPAMLVIDSIQTMFVDTLDSAPGTVAQVRTSAQELIRFAKRRGSVVVLVGHVTKEGQIAGPRVLEHMVDTVLHFEGERGHQFRILRAIKNRFGPGAEIGVFEMTDRGLAEVANPSALFIGERAQEATGAVIFAGIEGSRPVLVEIQALVAPSPLATPRRAVVGWDAGRLAMLMAVLDARCALALGGNDVYLNVAGGLRINEPAADLAVAAALVSSAAGVPVAADTVVFGEVGLSGEVRAVSQTEVRLKEAAKLGFARAIVPRRRDGRGRAAAPAVVEVGRLAELVDDIAGTG